MISAAFFAGTPAAILSAWSAGEFDLVISDEVVEEYRETLDRMRRTLGDPGVERLLDGIIQNAIRVVPGALPLGVCTDPDDMKFLECAVSGRADHLITGDRALLRCDGFAGIRIVTPARFLRP